MTITETRHNQTFHQGNLISEEAVEVDITAKADDTTLRDQARTAFLNNKAFLTATPTTAEALQQIKALTRQINGLIRLVVDAGLVD